MSQNITATKVQLTSSWWILQERETALKKLWTKIQNISKPIRKKEIVIICSNNITKL